MVFVCDALAESRRVTGGIPARSWPRTVGRLTVAATVVGLGALTVGLVALIRSDGSSVAVVVLAAALLVGALLVLASQHLSGPVASFLAIAAIWTSVLLLGVLFFVGGRAVPCPELGTVGQPGRDDAAIGRMCEQREAVLHPRDLIAANEPASWLVVWGIGIAVAGGGIAVAARRHRA